MNGNTWTEVQWGVRYPKDIPTRLIKAGSVEYYGTKPGGSNGRFTESEARYIANGSGAEVVRRVVVHSVTQFDWSKA
jgi:hypothetical protein